MVRFLIKPVNSALAIYSSMISSFSGDVVTRGIPFAISAELTNHCNLRCPECGTGSGQITRPKGYMTSALFDKLISEIGPYLYNINLYFQGEPMLHPEFFSFIEKSNNIRTVVATNGHFLTEKNAERLTCSGLNQLIVSLDGMDQQAYSSYRVNGDFNKVMEGIKNVIKAKERNSSPLKIIIQFLVNKNNEEQILQVKKFAHETKVSLKLKSMQIINRDAYISWLPSINKFRRYENKCNGYTLKSKLPDRCSRLWLNPVITWDGKVLPCCFDKNAAHVMGDINKNSFREIWTGPEYTKFRMNLLSGRSIIEICRNCTSGLKGVIF